MTEGGKTIIINPELFKVQSTNRTRKKRDAPAKIRMKKPAQPAVPSNKSLRKNIIKMIRQNQQKKYESMFSPPANTIPKKPTETTETEFAKNFDQTVDFFQTLAKTKKDKIPKHNTTIRMNTHKTAGENSFPKDEFVSMELPADFLSSTTPSPPSSLVTKAGRSPQTDSSIGQNVNLVPQSFLYDKHIAPTYGCLKGGKLPTYRQYTHKQNPSKTPLIDQWKINQKELREKYKNDRKENASAKPEKKVIRNLKRRKLYKRTYHIGRHKVQPRVGVLISNRTVRNKIATDCQMLKQTPIQDVKKFLLKKGFIKIGTSAPNEVLRKMYESVSMICGEIQNHNSENFLYNYLHDSESSDRK